MTSYLIIPSTDGRTSCRVDLGSIASLFTEGEPASAPGPRWPISLAARLLASGGAHGRRRSRALGVMCRMLSVPDAKGAAVAAGPAL